MEDHIYSVNKAVLCWVALETHRAFCLLFRTLLNVTLADTTANFKAGQCVPSWGSHALQPVLLWHAKTSLAATIKSRDTSTPLMNECLGKKEGWAQAMTCGSWSRSGKPEDCVLARPTLHIADQQQHLCLGFTKDASEAHTHVHTHCSCHPDLLQGKKPDGDKAVPLSVTHRQCHFFSEWSV